MNIRNSIFWAHLTVGIVVGTVVFIMASTGMMLAFRSQIISFVEHDLYQIDIPEMPSNRLSMEQLLKKIGTDYPDDSPMGVTISADPHAPLMVNLGEDNALYVNPYTGVVLGNGSKIRHWFKDVEYWHRWLGMKGNLKVLGGGIKRACNVAFLFMIITGLYLWWPSQWIGRVFQALTRLNFKLKGHARDWNLHSVIGFWCAPFLITISLTGLIMSYPWANNLLYRMTGNVPPLMTEHKEHHHHDDDEDDDDDQPSGLSLDALLTRAQTQESNWKTITLRLSRHADAPAVFTIEEPGVGHRSQLTLNRSSGAVIKWEPYFSQNSGRRLRTFVRFLHTGEAGGWIGQTIAFLAAGGLLVLIWTGFSMAWRRFFKKDLNKGVV